MQNKSTKKIAQLESTENFIVYSPYKGKSKFEFWMNIKVNDVLNVSINFEVLGRGRGLYAPTIEVKNLTQETSIQVGWNDGIKYLQKMELIGDKSVKDIVFTKYALKSK